MQLKGNQIKIHAAKFPNFIIYIDYDFMTAIKYKWKQYYLTLSSLHYGNMRLAKGFVPYTHVTGVHI